ncbi:MAG TPA: caspase family protein [Dyella sp.]|uniref:caspase family protein n=1 Tax=Dyella sp. TaxID=1869338 RepID=UPI002B993A93|nr:caspase family protein [Dyella sp.]HTV84364.1 caspase family protein [Dyella sp.]
MSLTRKALLIMSPDEEIPGVMIDKENWNNHLHSPTGGAWQGSEVQLLVSPTRSELISAMNWLNVADYTFIAYSGHGSARSETETILNINDQQTIAARDLISKAAKQTLILDCCRRLQRRGITEARLIKSIAMDSYKDPNLARILFDQHLRDCAPFRVQLNSCSLDQYAGDDDTAGGIYTAALIRSAQATPSGKVLGIREAHHAARQVVIDLQPSQTPTGMYPRSGPSFPFGIGL